MQRPDDSLAEHRTAYPGTNGAHPPRACPENAVDIASDRFLALVHDQGFSDAHVQLLEEALEFANRAHEGELRQSGEPFVLHPIEVAIILVNLKLDAETIAGALLHDVVEDSDTTLDTIRDRFGLRIRVLVDGVTKLSQIQWAGDSDQAVTERDEQAENLRKMFLATADDIGVVLIKLADRLHNMRTLEYLPAEKQRRIAQQTLEIYAPLANRLGIWPVKTELEDLSFKYLQPFEFAQIRKELDRRGEFEAEFVERVKEIIRNRLSADGINARLTGRQKHIYSIYRKMLQKQRRLDEIYDVIGIRVIVDSKADCYAAIGIVHEMWHPIPGEIDDYIALPKESSYQSLHTAVRGPDGHALEIQIRTQEMHDDAEYGVAAHWRYKEGRKSDPRSEARIAWLRQLMDWREEMSNAQEFVELLKSDVFKDKIYVFTPKGDIVELPGGATPLDFAYRIHTEVGHHCVGAKVNERMIRLDQKLQNGDLVEIITSKAKVGPSRDWLQEENGYVTTGGAREKIRQWFRKQERTENVQQGKATLDKELRRLGIDLQPEEILDYFPRYNAVDEFLAAIGYGGVSAQSIAAKLGERNSKELLEPSKSVKRPTGPQRVVADGAGNLLMNLAACCKPVFGDDIDGFITRGRGITVHRSDCKNILNVTDTDRLIPVNWQDSVSTDTYAVPILVHAFDRVGLLKDLSTLMADENVNILFASTNTHMNREVTVSLTIEVQDLVQLSRVLHKISGIQGIYEVRRDASGAKAPDVA